MELDINVAGKSISIPIDDPFHLDIDAMVARINAFLSEQDAGGAGGLDIRGLLPKMVKGIAGCEGGCPADAKSFVSRGFNNFKLAYIEGGILEARVATESGKNVAFKMFPDF
jgi:hypothetical protein